MKSAELPFRTKVRYLAPPRRCSAGSHANKARLGEFRHKPETAPLRHCPRGVGATFGSAETESRPSGALRWTGLPSPARRPTWASRIRLGPHPLPRKEAPRATRWVRQPALCAPARAAPARARRAGEVETITRVCPLFGSSNVRVWGANWRSTCIAPAWKSKSNQRSGRAPTQDRPILAARRDSSPGTIVVS
jgi:hypothetical protein